MLLQYMCEERLLHVWVTFWDTHISHQALKSCKKMFRATHRLSINTYSHRMICNVR